MLQTLSHKIIKLIGWQIDISLPKERKFVLIGAPHTSNWDFPLALFSAMGGIPVDRSSSQGFTQQIANRFAETDEMALTLSPEGTRAKTRYWKSGFYHIANTANVPICLAYINYREKKMGFSEVLYPSGDIDADMKIIAEFYSEMRGKTPQNQGPVRLKEK